MDKDFFKAFQDQFLIEYSLENIVEQLYLTSLLESSSRVSEIKGIKEMSENEIRDELVYDLTFHNSKMMSFIQNKTVKLANENRIIEEDANYRTDIEFFISTFGTFIIECKKLSSNDARYINEGVARFTTRKYSKFENEAGLIGFVTGGNISSIVEGLKERCKAYEAANKNAEFIEKLCLEMQFSFHSKHLRNDYEDILLHHIFFDFRGS